MDLADSVYLSRAIYPLSGISGLKESEMAGLGLHGRRQMENLNLWFHHLASREKLDNLIWSSTVTCSVWMGRCRERKDHSELEAIFRVPGDVIKCIWARLGRLISNDPMEFWCAVGEATDGHIRNFRRDGLIRQNLFRTDRVCSRWLSSFRRSLRACAWVGTIPSK